MGFSIDSTVGDLLENAGTRAFIEKTMPELVNHPAMGMIRGMSLRAIAPFSNGKLTDEILTTVDAALQKI